MIEGHVMQSGWRPAHLEDLVFFQRGYDITKAEQKPGEFPVVSSSGISSYHSESKVNGPGVVIGRKGSLGTVHYIEGPYWPHDTTLWSKGHVCFAKWLHPDLFEDLDPEELNKEFLKDFLGVEVEGTWIYPMPK